MKINKSKLMKKAWDIARKAMKNFGGKVREYLSESLRTAWSIMKMGTAELIEKLIIEADSAGVTEKREGEIIDMLPGLRVKEAIESIKDANPQINLTKKQTSFYDDIKTYLINYALEKGESFLSRDIEDQLTHSGDEIMITIRRIAEMLNSNLNKSNFSEIVDDFYFIKNGGMFQPVGKYEHLRNIWG